MLACLAVAGLGGVAQVSAAMQDPSAASAAEGEPSSRVFSAFRAEVGGLPRTADAEDLEASLMYVVSQSDQPVPVLLAALDQLRAAPNGTPALASAIGRVRTALTRRRVARGTAALGGSGFGFGSAFSSPISGIGGGGSSNYTR